MVTAQKFFIANGSDKVMVADTSDSTQFIIVCIRKASAEEDESGSKLDESGSEPEEEEEAWSPHLKI